MIKKEHKEIALWAADCAEHVLVNFEKISKDDKRPHDAIEATRLWASGDMKMVDARKAAFASHAAAREVTDKSAQYAARSAGHAAATAHVATHAPQAANYAVKSAVESGKENEKNWQIERLPHDLNDYYPSGTTALLVKKIDIANKKSPRSGQNLKGLFCLILFS